MVRQSLEYQIECYREIIFLNQDLSTSAADQLVTPLSSFLLPSKKWCFFYSGMYSTLRDNLDQLFNSFSFDELNTIPTQEKSITQICEVIMN